MPTVLEWNPTVEPSGLVSRVGEAFAAGEAIVLPGEVGYCLLVDPLSPVALRCLDRVPEPPSLLAYSPEDASRYGLPVPEPARRLMIRAWPAPLHVGLPGTAANLPAEWPQAIRDQLASGGMIRFRCPDHRVFDALFPSFLKDGFCRPALVFESYAATAEEALAQFGAAATLVVAAGDVNPGRLTVVQAEPERWGIAAQGAFTQIDVQRLAARIVLFVCTGNTCRSPMAEGLARKMLSERFECPAEDLPARGLWVLSAGVSAYAGAPASPESIDVAAEFGADIRPHRSRPLNPQLLAAADDVIAMTRGHALAIAAAFPGLGPAPRLLGGEDDLDDPIGASLEVYRDCAQTIMKHLERFLPEWVRS